MSHPKVDKTVIIDYLNLQKKYQQLYGEKTIVLYMLGSFYDIFGYDPAFCTKDEHKRDKSGKIWNEHIGYAEEMSTLLNSTLTQRKPKEAYTILNCHMVGIPVNSYEKKYERTILGANYTIVKVDQLKAPKGGKITRAVSAVIDPTTNIDSISLTRPSSNIASLYIEYQNSYDEKVENYIVSIGAAVIDVITGNNRVSEIYSLKDDPNVALQDVYRFLISNHPRELIINVTDLPKHNAGGVNPYIKYLECILELKRFDRITMEVDKLPIDYQKIPYQIEFFNRLLTTTAPGEILRKNNRIIEDLGLQHHVCGRIAYMALLQHCHSRCPSVIQNISRPDLKFFDEDKHLLLAHNAITQLDILPSSANGRGAVDSLLSVLDHNKTLIGKRALLSLINSPLRNISDIQTYYDMVADMMQCKINDDFLWQILDRSLRELPDISRLQRKLSNCTILPKELTLLFSAYLKIVQIYVTIINANTKVLVNQLLSQTEITQFNTFISCYGSSIDFGAMDTSSIECFADSDRKYIEFKRCPLVSHPEVEALNQTLLEAEKNLENIVDHLNTFIPDGTTRFKTAPKKISVGQCKAKNAKGNNTTKKQDHLNTVLFITDAKANVIVGSNFDVDMCGVIKAVSYTSSEMMLTSDVIQKWCSVIDETKSIMRTKIYDIYITTILPEMNRDYSFYFALVNFIAKIDVTHSYALISHKYNYHRPDLVTEDCSSFIEAKDIRHPIIERINAGKYVTNDILLGQGSVDNGRSNGVLLYGTNQTGKSSLAKAVALNIIMAQIGCYVPSHLRFKPCARIITRLTNGTDDLFKQMSTFAIEMTELRTILRQADENTLVLGDELSSGTETKSGISLVASSLEWLKNRNIMFIFATHMHELLDLKFIKDIPEHQIKICHLSMSRDQKTNTLIYDRKLMPGSGLSMYGIMVAESLDLPAEFIERAYEILKEVNKETPYILPTKKSHYNTEMYLKMCEICKKTAAEIVIHTHHIEHRSEADERGLIGNMHMNNLDNMVGLCSACHTNLHRSHLEMEVKDTGNGKIIVLVE